MEPAFITDLLSFTAPLLVVVGLMLLVPAALAPHARLTGSVTLFGALLLTAARVLLGGRSGLAHHFLPADSAIVTLLLLGAGIAIAPLTDRARPASLMLIAPLAAYLALSALFAFNAAGAVVLNASVVTLSLTALLGSAILPAHPARYTVAGQLRSIVTSQAALLSGWVLLAASIVVLSILLGAAPDMALLALSAVIAALASLLTTRAEDGLAKAGEAIAASAVLTACATLNVPVALLLGLVASFVTSRSEAISLALRVDDPQHLIGALLLPAMLGLVLPGLLDLAHLAPQILWLVLALGTGLALAALLWPLVMLVTGLALPRRRVLEGVRAG